MVLIAETEYQFSQEFLLAWIRWDLIHPMERAKLDWVMSDDFFFYCMGYEL